jgi:diphthamide biosynthesis protein 2
MGTLKLESAPVLSTPDTHIFEDPAPQVTISLPELSDEQLYITYEIQRTVTEIRCGRWRRIALQFPDEMLPDAPRVYKEIDRRLREGRSISRELAVAKGKGKDPVERLEEDVADTHIQDVKEEERKIFILGDTSYGACCIDEIAAEHVDAEVVVHYGRSCLSPPARLPVIYVYTTRPLSIHDTVRTFKSIYSDLSQGVILMADLPYQSHLTDLSSAIQSEGYTNFWMTTVIHNPSSPLPNRSVPERATEDPAALRFYSLFHIGSPPPALLLTLSSRVSNIQIYDPSHNPTMATPASSSLALRRRYALLTSLSTVSIFGILINTLSVRNYLHVVQHVQEMIAAAGKKSYTFVVGKINAAKIANFAEVQGWVVVGCWESSLVEGKEFYRPVITPFELELALKSDAERVWDGSWRSDWETMLTDKIEKWDIRPSQAFVSVDTGSREDNGTGEGDFDDEEESAPPEFDLRTGRYVSHTRPMLASHGSTQQTTTESATAPAATGGVLIKRANGDIAQVGGMVSPAAEFLRSQRTWRGLGSDFDNREREGVLVEEGRTGIARGYTVGESTEKH